MSLDSQSFSSSPALPLPDDVLLLILHKFTPFERCRLLSISKDWNQTIMQHPPFWQYLTIPQHLSLSSAISILQIFNARSNFTLKHFILKNVIDSRDSLNEIFTELSRSSTSMRLLALFQNSSGLNTEVRRLSSAFLPNLNTLHIISSGLSEFNFEGSISNMELKRFQSSASKDENSKQGLRYYYTTTLSGFEGTESRWFEQLKFFKCSRSSTNDSRFVLKAAKINLVELHLQSWAPIVRSVWQPPFTLESEAEEITFPNLSRLQLPFNPAAAMAVGKLIRVTDEREGLILKGPLRSLFPFQVPFLNRLELVLEPLLLQNGPPNLPLAELYPQTQALFKQMPFFTSLSVLPQPGVREGGKHLGIILAELCIPKQVQVEGIPITEEGIEEEVAISLPRLKTLWIRDVRIVDRGLLKRCFESRKGRDETFKAHVLYEKRFVTLQEWEKRLDESAPLLAS